MSLLTYLGIALSMMHADSLATVAARERYNLVGSFTVAIFWPITIPGVIVIQWLISGTDPPPAENADEPIIEESMHP